MNFEVSMIDSSGNKMLCECGNPATGGMFGATAFITWCNDCNPNKPEKESGLVYKPGSIAEYGARVRLGALPLDDSWVIDCE